MPATGGQNEFHFEPLGDPLHDRRAVRFHQHHNIRPLRRDDFRKRIRPSLAAIENVIAHQAHAEEMVGSGRDAVTPHQCATG